MELTEQINNGDFVVCVLTAKGKDIKEGEVYQSFDTENSLFCSIKNDCGTNVVVAKSRFRKITEMDYLEKQMNKDYEKIKQDDSSK